MHWDSSPQHQPTEWQTEGGEYAGSLVVLGGDFESATNPRVVLVINNNIYIIDLILIASKFQKRSMIGMARTNGCGPLKILRTRLASTRLFIFILVIQDHIESIGKANTIKRG